TVSEGVLCALVFVAFAAWRVRTGRGLGVLTAASPDSTALRWSTRGFVVALLLAAMATRALRGRHERQLEDAKQLVDAGRYSEALATVDRADGWPQATRPGRVDLIRADAYLGLGQSRVAESLYLRAYEEDPTNFWAVADLAEYYASSDRPAAERRRL